MANRQNSYGAGVIAEGDLTAEGVITIWFLHPKKLLRNVKCLLSNEINRFLHEV
jgi:hypothetical protein